MNRLRAGFAIAALVGVAVLLASNVGARPALDGPGMAGKRSVTPRTSAKKAQHGWLFECTALSGGANTNLDCDDPFPNNEPHVAVDPADPQHLVASSNDYGSCCDQYYTTFDGGRTWSTGNMSIENSKQTGSDPVTTIDRKHRMTLHSSLNYVVNASGEACDGDVVVSPSTDGGLSWLKPVIVDKGRGCDLSKTQIFNDKEWIVTDNNPSSPRYGRTYLTWSRFESHDGSYASSAIWESHSDDGGSSWSRPQEISGSNPALCTFQTAGPAGQCDENQFSVPTVATDGTVYVAFENGQNEALWESDEQFDSQYLLVKSTNGGATWSSPRFVVGLEDGSNDYPRNVNGDQTLTGYQVRVDSAGNIVASPTDGKLYLVFSDNRNGGHDSVSPTTNIDSFVMSSENGGLTWTAPRRVDAARGDQWFPWVDVNPANGKIGILYNDRGNANGALYTAALAEGRPAALAKRTISTAPSDPTRSIFFQAEASGCGQCATFHGDYVTVAYGKNGTANMVWTDMREFRPADAGFAQEIFFARR